MNQMSYVDGLKHNLISVSQLCDNGIDVKFKIKYCIMYKADTLIEVMRANRRGDLYLICFEALKAKEEICLVSSIKNEEAWIWHTRFHEKEVSSSFNTNKSLEEIASSSWFAEPIGKFDPKRDDAILVGYSWDSTTYRVYVPRSQIVVVSTNVKFNDNFQ
ncbi:hypothetical protein OSB04_024113, partial [Centaurea solstitialis]